MTIAFNLFVQKVPLTIESIIAKLEINPKSLVLIANMKAVLTTEELRYDFLMRMPHRPSGTNVRDLIDEMRDEQLQLNPMSHESFLDLYMLNPITALTQYFMHSVSSAHVERIKLWGINIKDIIKLKQLNNNIHLNTAMETLYLKQL